MVRFFLVMAQWSWGFIESINIKGPFLCFTPREQGHCGNLVYHDVKVIYINHLADLGCTNIKYGWVHHLLSPCIRMQGLISLSGGSMHNGHHLNLELSQAQSTSLMASCMGTTKVTRLSLLLNEFFPPFIPAFPTILISSMPSPVVPPDTGRHIQLEKGQENFSPAENKVLR